MGLTKYKGFQKGDDLPGVNIDSIDPENITPQSAGYLVGGTGHSALSVFQALGAGANDGKFKINVDGNVYDNVGIDLLPPSNINVGGNSSLYGLHNNSCGQSFTLTKETYVTQIGLYITKSSSGNWNFVMNLYAANNDGSPTGPVLATVTLNAGTPPYLNGWQYLTVNQSLPAGKYHLACPPSSQSYEWYTQVFYNTSSYSGGSAFYNGVAQAGKNLYMSVQVNSTISLSSIAGSIQSAIRTATGKTETVIYDTNHYKITSAKLGRDSKILKLMSPSTGTDISGAGATPYLDCAGNATEVLGMGEEWNLVRLNENGLIPTIIIDVPKQIRNGTTSFDGSSSTAITINAGFRPSVVRVFACFASYVSFGSWNLIDGNKCAFNQTGVANAVYDVLANNRVTGVIQNITDTGFDIKPSGGGSGTVYIFWEAEK